MRSTHVVLVVSSIILAGGMPRIAAGQEVQPVITMWVPGGLVADPLNSKLIPVGKLPGKKKIDKACGGTGGMVQAWTVMSVDTRSTRDAAMLEVYSDQYGKLAERVGSLRADATCTIDGKKWVRLTGVIEGPETYHPLRSSRRRLTRDR